MIVICNSISIGGSRSSKVNVRRHAALASGLCHDVADPNGGATVREMKEGSRIDVGADVEKGLEIAAVSQYFGNRRLG
jgi:hypothetical protein